MLDFAIEYIKEQINEIEELIIHQDILEMMLGETEEEQEIIAGRIGYYTICITDNYKEFKSQRECARYYEISQSTLSRTCINKTPIEINGCNYYFISIKQDSKLC